MTQRIIIAIDAEQRVLLLKRYNYVSDHNIMLLFLLSLYFTTHINKLVVRAVHIIII